MDVLIKSEWKWALNTALLLAFGSNFITLSLVFLIFNS